MPEWIAVSRTSHAEAYYRPREGYGHAAGQLMVPALLAELHKLIPHYVIGLLPAGEGLAPVALLGVEQHHNLYLHPDGRWLGHYVPALLRGYPFALADGQGDDKVLAVDAQQVTDDGEPLFDNGELNAGVAETLRFLQQCEASRHATSAAGKALQDAGVVTEWSLTVPVGEGHKRVNGLYRVDEQALNALDAETYATLQGAPMQLAYAQLYSQSQVEQLTQRAEIHAQLEQANTTPDLDAMFGEDDDELNFDFD